jgi:hypothetical protein
MTPYIRKQCVAWFGPNLPRCLWEIFAFAELEDAKRFGKALAS